MSSVNKTVIMGNLGQDPEMRYTKTKQPVCNFSVATNTSWKDAEGNKKERTEWHRIVVWGNTAKACAKYLKKGRGVYLEGQNRTRTWEDDNGVTRSTTEIHTSNVLFLNDGRAEVVENTGTAESLQTELDLDEAGAEVLAGLDV